MSLCLTCQNPLTGRQTKFCSRKCKNANTNSRLQNYEAQQKRGIQRRAELIRVKGGKCMSCGYDKNQAALSFHHKDPSQKDLPIDIRRCSNNKLETLKKEVEKCDLLCHNCHMETHYPHLALA